MSDPSTTYLETARAALDQCQELLAETSPAWAKLHAALHVAQRAIAVAEHCSNEAIPVVAPVPELAVPGPTSAPVLEPEPLPAAGASLAERLSEQRLESLKNSLSINNRVRFASLLTDGDVPALLNLCDALEASENFEAAQVLLLETSGDVDWEDEENGGFEFIALVRRLFATA